MGFQKLAWACDLQGSVAGMITAVSLRLLYLICELTVPPRFAGPPAHIHHDFDEVIYVLSGALTMTRGRPIPNPRPLAPSSSLPEVSGIPSPTPPMSRFMCSARGAQQAR